MTPAEASWVREYVWTPLMRRLHADNPELEQKCACQWGPCGYCVAGEHEKCRQTLATRPESPATWVVSPEGTVPTIRPGLPARVYELGHRHVWSCPCLPDHAPRAVQDDLLSLLGATS